MNKVNRTLLGVTTVSALLLGACTSVSQVKSDGTTDAVVWPDAKKVGFKTGSFPEPEALRLVRPGMTKDQLSNLLGRPHFNEGLIGVVEWDYLFHFPLGNGSVQTCQFKAIFDKNRLAQSYYWREPQCAAMLNKQPAAAVPVTQVELSADALFQFDGAQLDQLLPQGRGALTQLAKHLNQDYAAINKIVVTGHTDRLGSDAYNLRLGQVRADTVRYYLQQQGVTAPISTHSVGKNQPKSSGCTDSQDRAALRTCLQVDRRVSIDISGIKK